MRTLIKPFLHWKFLLTYGICWIVVNLWAFVCLGLGTYFHIGWLIAISSGWIGILAIPNGVGVFLPLPLAIVLQTMLFPRDAVLKKELNDIKFLVKWNKWKRWII